MRRSTVALIAAVLSLLSSNVTARDGFRDHGVITFTGRIVEGSCSFAQKNYQLLSQCNHNGKNHTVSYPIKSGTSSIKPMSDTLGSVSIRWIDAKRKLAIATASYL